MRNMHECMPVRCGQERVAVIRAAVNGRPVSVEQGTTILEAAKSIGVEIPTLCFSPGMEPSISCFVCSVKIEGLPNLVPACATRVQEGMRISTDTAEIREARTTALELLLSDHAGDCTAPCQSACPAHIEIPTFLGHIRRGEQREALRVIRRKTAFPGVLGRICPEICERACRRKDIDSPVAVCHLKRFAADCSPDTGTFDIPRCAQPSGMKAAVVGAGPAGLSAAYYLLQKGHACTVIDNNAEPGGALRYRIVRKRLPAEVLDAEIRIIQDMGCRFIMEQEWGVDFSLDDLKGEYDAVFLACGNLENSENAAEQGLSGGKHGIVADRRTFQTSVDSVFAGGACVRKTDAAVRACADGRRAAVSMDQCMRGNPVTGEPDLFSVHMGRLSEAELAAFTEQAKDIPRAVDIAAGNINPGEQRKGFTEQEAVREAGRCLECDCAEADNCGLRILADEYSARPATYRGTRRTFQRDTTHPDIIYEPGKCIMCGICVRLAEKQREELGLAFIGRGFNVTLKVPFNSSIESGLRRTALKCAELCPTGALYVRRQGP